MPADTTLSAERYAELLECTNQAATTAELANETIRTFMKRFARLRIGFSRKFANLEAAIDLHMAYFNFCWRPGEKKVTPAQAAGIAGHVWTFDELLAD